MRRTLEDLRRDLSYGVRLLARNRSFTIVAGLTLALGIGATSTIFSVLHASVLAPLPFHGPEQLVWVQEVNGQGQTRGIPVATLDAWRDESRTLAGVAHALMGQVNFTLSGAAGAERVAFEQVDFRTFELLGVPPVLGRWFRPDEVVVQGNTAQTVVISYGLWQRLFGGDPDVVGKTLPGWSAGWGETVIGVMPRGFYTHPSRLNTDAWYVITENPGATIGRLAARMNLDQAQAELEVLARQRDGGAAQRTTEETWRVQVLPLHEVYRAGYARTLYMLLGAVGFVLLIAAVNVANLQLNRGVTRQAEMAVRIALGAPRWRLLRQLLAENVLLVMLGGLLGVVVAVVGIRLFVYVAPNFYPPSDEIGVNGTVLLFTLAVCIATGILSGMAPGMRTSAPDLHTTLKQGGRGAAGTSRLHIRRTLVVAEIALAMVLLAGAGLMINSYARATTVQMGISPQNVLRMDVSLMGMDKYRTRYGTNHYAATTAGAQFYSTVLERLTRIPGVESAGLTSVLPPGGGPLVPIRVAGRGGQGAVQFHEVSADFFETMRIPVIRGRVVSETDHGGAPGVAVINDAFARQYFPGEDPIGQAIHADLTGQNPALDEDRLRQVVGVVGDVRMGLRAEFAPIVYIPYQQHLMDYPGFAYFGIHAIKNVVIRASTDPAALVPAVRRAFSDADSTVAVAGVMPMRDALAAAAGPQAFWMRLLGIFAALGTILAAIGIYGVVSYSMAQRTHEFGIRATLGAQKADILKLVVREGLAVTLIGLLIGMAGVFASTRLIEGQLFGISRLDPLTIAAVALVLAAVSALACYIPARRTTKVDPLVALRVE